ncbi:inter-alpha-trypsin inhibitor heavy chain H3-like [Brienomyrus brachyistius]|uniref:inter-alpha-trypsin inhibitor heavy chain H3-like n=1 Tax=Brienomyrus brachyistius TaxID=42636 RepID=UPI0020B1993E|nr:inter-alpha-trypsin inhibitor heavy chain H3-like [Brienomyrus brachyistius]
MPMGCCPPGFKRAPYPSALQFCLEMVPLVILSFLLASVSSAVIKRDVQKDDGIDIYSFHIKSMVQSRYAMTVITSRVANLANESHEVNFHVEIPKNAFISKFSMTIDGKIYDGVVKEKAEAQQQYDQAVQRGQSAGLVSAVGRTLEEFKTSVTVAAHSKVTFELTYEELLKRRLGQYELLIKAKPTQAVKDFKIEVQIRERQGIRFLDTRGKLISKELDKVTRISQSDDEATVQFAPTKQQQQQCPGCETNGLDGDLLIVYDVNRPKSKSDFQVLKGYFVHYFAPTDLPRIPKNVVFIIDRSGSMHGVKIKQTREALLKILGDISEEDHFGLISFDNAIYKWKPNLVPATPGNLEAAQAFVRQITDQGATDINNAVLEGVRMLNNLAESHDTKDSTSILILLTDGDPTSGVTNLDSIQANVKEAIGKRYSLYCLGFGFDVNYEFLEKMALQNSGVARRIYPDSDADLQLQGFYEEVATPLLLDVQLSYTGVSNLTQSNFSQYYNGTEIVVAGQISDNDLETLTGTITARSKNNEVTYQDVSVKEENLLDIYIFEMYIQRLWAYLTVKQLLQKEVLLGQSEKEALRKQALDLSLKYSFVTPLTSMVVTKPEGEDSQVLHKPKEGKPDHRGHPGMFDDVDYDYVGPYIRPTIQGRQPVEDVVDLRILQPTAGHSNRLCFDVQVSQKQNYKLLDDQTADLLVVGQVNSEAKKGFRQISIRSKAWGSITVDTTKIVLIQGQKNEDFSWTPFSFSDASNGLSLNMHDEVLTVEVGETKMDILLHRDGQNSFLWPAVKKRPPSSTATGIIGQFLVSYEEKQVIPTGILEIQDKEVPASRETAVNYNDPSKPRVDCWLVPYQSVLGVNLSELTVVQT